MSDCKPCQLVECVPANDFSYSLAVPPAPLPGPLPFGNDQLQYCCPDAETLNVSTTVPGWATISGNCILVKPNTFRALDKALANGQAQATLDAFVSQYVTCGTTSFVNAPATYYKTCTGGIYEGPPSCETVNAGVFTSAVSQLDADTMARYAAYIALIFGSVGPCCSGPSYLGAGGWSNASTPDQNTTDTEGRTANWTWNDTGAVLTFDFEMVPNVTRPDTNAAIGLTMLWNYCNAWPTYDFHIHVDYAWDATNINGVGVGVAIEAVYALGSTLALPILSEATGTFGSSSYDVSFPAGLGGDSIQIEVVLGNPNTTHVASGFFRGTMTITPLTPPTYSAPTCGVISTVPVPFDYALRPENDDFEDAILLGGASGSLVFDNTYASIEPNEPLTINNFESDRTGWYRWTAPFSGTVTFDPAGSTLINDPAIAVYSGGTLLTLVSIVEKNQTAPPFTWTATGGVSYYWRIGGFGNDRGVTHLAWNLV